MDNLSEPAHENQYREITQEVAHVVKEYASQTDYLDRVNAKADSRSQEVTKALQAAFASVIRPQEVELIDFQSLTVMELGSAIEQYPVILKPLLTVCNVAGRAIERDLDLKNIDTYSVSLSPPYAHAIAGYIKGLLPLSLPVTALVHMDRVSYIDKEIRAHKGQWEKMINQALIRFSGLPFKKAKFRRGNELYELDCAYRQEEQVLYGIDVKRIEARRDIHKRCDEIVNKASRLKEAQPDAKFGAIIYYPFPTEHGNIRDRLSSPFIDSIQFAGETQQSVNQAVRLLLAKFEVTTKEDLT